MKHTYQDLMKLAAQYVAEEKPKLNAPELTADFLRPLLKDLKQEEVHLLCLDTRNRLIGHHLVTRGTLTASQVHPREIFRPAIADAAARVIIAHNHPSGDPEPSKQDIAVTETVYSAGEIIGIPLVDHIIIGGYQFVSLRLCGFCG